MTSRSAPSFLSVADERLITECIVQVVPQTFTTQVTLFSVTLPKLNMCSNVYVAVIVARRFYFKECCIRQFFLYNYFRDNKL